MSPKNRASSSRVVTAQLLIKADADVIYDFLANPANHAVLDGSGTLDGQARGPERLTAGSAFSMAMHQGPMRYRSLNRVVEAEPGKVLAWRTVGERNGKTVIGGQVWRFELKPHVDGGTVVRHSFDWGQTVTPRLVQLLRYPQRMARSMPQSLERLARAVGGGS